MLLHVLLLPGGVNTSYALFPDLVAAVFFGLFIGVAGTLIWHSRKLAVLENVRASDAETFNKEQQELQQMCDQRVAECEALKQENERLSKRLAEIVDAAKAVEVPVVENKKKKDETFFMSQPNRNGRFLESGRHSEAEKAIYQFHVQPDNPAVANFEFVAKDVYLKVALGNEPTWINIACERNNAPGERTTSVQTLSPGQAVLNGDEWEITRKAKITYL